MVLQTEQGNEVSQTSLLGSALAQSQVPPRGRRFQSPLMRRGQERKESLQPSLIVQWTLFFFRFSFFGFVRLFPLSLTFLGTYLAFHFGASFLPVSEHATGLSGGVQIEIKTIKKRDYR